jgi:hypothetical protein
VSSPSRISSAAHNRALLKVEETAAAVKRETRDKLIDDV